MKYLILLIVIIVVLLVAVYALGLFRLRTVTTTMCSIPSPFFCVDVSLAGNGLLTINLTQTSPTPINVTALGCAATNATNGATFGNRSASSWRSWDSSFAVYMHELPEQVNMLPGGNHVFNVSCGSNYSEASGTDFYGYFLINYTQMSSGSSGFTHNSTVGQMIVEVT
jgi:hypothetical protein